MSTLQQQFVELIAKSPGLTDREITYALRGEGAPQQPINQAAHALVKRQVIVRRQRSDGLIGNFLSDQNDPPTESRMSAKKRNETEALSEDELKRVLAEWLTSSGWTAVIAWGKRQGIDIDARRGAERWIIEVKGPGSLQAMRVNYFIGILGETLQRMSDANAMYSIALPDLQQYRRLWDRLPGLAKQRTKITAIFVSSTGDISHVR